MPLKTLSFNRGIFMQNMRNVGWVGLIHLLTLSFALPLQILMAYSSERLPYYTHWKNVFSISQEFQVLIMFIIPVLLAIFSFRYLHVKLSADYIHSLPIRRESLFYHHLLFAMLMLLLPIMIIGAVLLFLQSTLHLDHFLSAYEIVRWLGTTFLMELFVFMASVFIGMVTGMSVLQGILFYIILLLPSGITILTLMNMKYFLYGFAVDYYLGKNIENIVPFFRVIVLANQPLTWKEIIVYLIFTGVFFTLSLWSYKKRDIETAGQAIVFRALRPVFKYGVAFCFMLVGSFYFGETQGEFAWILFGYLTASAFGYFVAEMILEKTWRVFHRWKGYLYFVFVMLVIGTFLNMDVTGYEKRLPSLAEVKRVYFDESIYALDADDYALYGDGSLRPSERFFTEKANIKNIYSFHEQIIEDQPNLSQTSRSSRLLVIGYELTNGKKIVRSYEIPFEKYKSFYEPIVTSKEYKMMHYPLLKKNDLSSLDKITIQPYSAWARTIFITDREKMAEFVAILKTELENETADQVFDHRDPWGDIELVWDHNERMNITWKKSYVHLDEWLKQNGFTKARETADVLTHAVVIKNTEGKPYGDLDFEKQLAKRKDALRITDKQQLEECLRQAGTNDEIPAYVIGFYYADNHAVQIETFDEHHVPEFIRKHFE